MVKKCASVDAQTRTYVLAMTNGRTITRRDAMRVFALNAADLWPRDPGAARTPGFAKILQVMVAQAG